MDHISVVKIFQTMENLPCISSCYWTSEFISAVKAQKGAFGNQLKKNIEMWFILKEGENKIWKSAQISLIAREENKNKYSICEIWQVEEFNMES